MSEDIILCIGFLILTIIGIILLHPLAIINGIGFGFYFGRIIGKLED